MMLTEENGVYLFECSKALWATSEIRDQYSTRKFTCSRMRILLSKQMMNC